MHPKPILCYLVRWQTHYLCCINRLRHFFFFRLACAYKPFLCLFCKKSSPVVHTNKVRIVWRNKFKVTVSRQLHVQLYHSLEIWHFWDNKHFFALMRKEKIKKSEIMCCTMHNHWLLHIQQQLGKAPEAILNLIRIPEGRLGSLSKILKSWDKVEICYWYRIFKSKSCVGK